VACARNLYAIVPATVMCITAYTYIPLTLYPPRGSRGISDIPLTTTFYQNYLAMSNTADVTKRVVEMKEKIEYEIYLNL
jgi:hypothetical protein